LPAASAGLAASSQESQRDSLKAKNSVLAAFAIPLSFRSYRIFSAHGVPPGSLITSDGIPSLVSLSSIIFNWVDLPTPS